MSGQQEEPGVIDEQMLQRAVEEQQTRNTEGIQLEELLELRLDYRNILKIYHLWSFSSLTKLQLDNNAIERIEGLENLTNLTWLDLSFNKIEVIEGLQTLVKLQDLSLFNNRISVIENLDTLQRLQVLSLGNNSIAQLENVIYLRRFQSLRTLNLAGNPICEEDRYKTFVSAYLPELVYLDYRLLDEQTRETANAKYQYAIEEMRQNEMQEQQAMEAQKISNEELQLHKDAFVENLNGAQLFHSMFADDPDAEKLALLPGVDALLEEFRSRMEAVCMQMFEAGLSQYSRRSAEVESFFSCSREAVAENKQKAAQIAAYFESFRRLKTAEMHQIQHAVQLETHLSVCRQQLTHTSEQLMSLELQLVDQLEDVYKEFERNISEMLGGFVEFVQGMFAQCRDLENQHHEQQLEIGLETLEKVLKNELEEEIPDDLAMLLVDKDTLINAANASHDTHLMKIDNREDVLRTHTDSWIKHLKTEIQEEEMKRNRKRISEIQNYIRFVKEELEDMTLPVQR
uniref:Dynein regulatory complex subunit 3 n=1 Tax=Danio rerio TaxID=7955 RepID=A0JMH9_DANRE|nr:dynein regulatory complex subunit 3 [Danio rerio]AAI25886.1 Zgc:153749 [Danio rerio]|eukprot:NP_001071195.1 dynein regulatory complex subunit 3 [Danio rerio]